MNELIESDPELYGADIEDIPPRKASDKKKSDYLNNNDLMLGKEGTGILSGNPDTDKLIL